MNTAASNADTILPKLWQAYRVSHDEALRNRLLLHYLPIARTTARYFARRHGKIGHLDDIMQAATWGLARSISRFDPNRGIVFDIYGLENVRYAIHDFIRSLDWCPRCFRDRLRRIQETAIQMEVHSGLPADDCEVAARLHMPVAKVQASMQLDRAHRGLNKSRFGDERADSIAQKNMPDPSNKAQCDELREILLNDLNPRERKIMMLHYYDSMTFDEIAGILGCTQSRVSQLHQGVLGQLRKRRNLEEACAA